MVLLMGFTRSKKTNLVNVFINKRLLPQLEKHFILQVCSVIYNVHLKTPRDFSGQYHRRPLPAIFKKCRVQYLAYKINHKQYNTLIYWFKIL